MRKKTIYFMIFIVVLIAVYDFYAIAKGGTEASISHIIFEWSYKVPFFTFSFGYLAGHLTWRIRDTKITKEISDKTRE